MAVAELDSSGDSGTLGPPLSGRRPWYLIVSHCKILPPPRSLSCLVARWAVSVLQGQAAAGMSQSEAASGCGTVPLVVGRRLLLHCSEGVPLLPVASLEQPPLLCTPLGFFE